jgi:glycosyltransferase involved in cell wall biosynthesis
MKLLLSGDEYCCYYKNHFYISDHSQMLIARYLQCFETINVVFRTKVVESESNLGKYKNKVTDNRINLQFFPFFQGPKQFFKQLSAVKEAAKKAVQDSDVAILRLPSTTSFAIWLACRKRVPYATEIVYDSYDAYHAAETLSNKTIWYILHKMQASACNKAIGVACVTAQKLQQHYYPIDSDALTSNYSSIEMPYEFLYKAREFPQKNQFSIVHVANQVNYKSRKGHNELIKALSIVRNNGVNAKITFVGEDYNNGIAKLLDLASFYGIRDHVTFTGFVSRDKLRQILIESDIAVLPTKVEGLPRVIIEAMALGLPCITTPVSGNPELIDTEFLVNYSDVECIARKIEELLKNKQLYEYESNVNYERSKEYTADILNARRTKFYNELKSMVLANKKKK